MHLTTPQARATYRQRIAGSPFPSDYDGLLRDRQLESLLAQRAALALIAVEIAGRVSDEAAAIQEMIRSR